MDDLPPLARLERAARSTARPASRAGASVPRRARPSERAWRDIGSLIAHWNYTVQFLDRSAGMASVIGARGAG